MHVYLRRRVLLWGHSTLSFLFYAILFSQLQKQALRYTRTIIPYSCWILFCYLSGIGAALLMVTLLYLLFPVDLWTMKVYSYVHNQWGWFPQEEEENPAEGIISCIFLLICPVLFAFLFHKMIKIIINSFKWQHEKNNL